MVGRLLTVTIGVLVAASAAEAQPSFNCRYAKLPAEVAICQSSELSELDRTMAQLYFSQLNRWTGDVRDDLQAFQQQWLEQRNACGYDHGCLSQSYYNQIQALQRWPE